MGDGVEKALGLLLPDGLGGLGGLLGGGSTKQTVSTSQSAQLSLALQNVFGGDSGGIDGGQTATTTASAPDNSLGSPLPGVGVGTFDPGGGAGTAINGNTLPLVAVAGVGLLVLFFAMKG
tara:strand:- start:151 stop:510 length:360 start_codon:yes stop_codon:yes gene_type:complete